MSVSVPHSIMDKRTRRGILILTLALVTAVPGCDALRTVRQCGYQGCPEDRRITAEIESLLAGHTALQPPNMVYVQTLNGVVYLSGQVRTPLQRTEAEDVARQAAGVTRVVNTISLGYRG
jgi:osmotically-inducible protein OsmY